MQPIGNFFMLPNDVFDLMLSPTQLAVFSYLLRCGDKSFTCFPSIHTIAQSCRISDNTARKALKYLEKRKLIKISGGYSTSKFGRPQNSTYVYQVNTHLFDVGFSRGNLVEYLSQSCNELIEGASCND